MPQTITTVHLLRDISEAYEAVKKTLAKAEKELLRQPDPLLAKKILQLKADKAKMEKECMYYGLDLKNPQYTSDLGGLTIGAILPLAVIANVALNNALIISSLIKKKIPLTIGIGLQMVMGGLFIGLLIPVVIHAFKRQSPLIKGQKARAS